MGIFTKKTKAPSAKASEAKDAKAKPASMKDLYGGEAAAKSGEAAKPARRYGNAYRRIVKPLITEKAANSASEGKYSFAVAERANKIEVAKAVAEIYGIVPLKVNIVSMPGKAVRYGRTLGKRKSWKKAIVTLPKGKTINIYEGV